MKPAPLPPSDDTEFWGEDADIGVSVPKVVQECECGANGDLRKCDHLVSLPEGGIQCAKCHRGTLVPGYMRVYKGKLVDLRSWKGPTSPRAANP